MRVKLSLMGDLCMPQPGLLSFHEAFPCLEAPTPMMWAPGFALQQNKLTKTVFHKSQYMALDGHDCGHWIPHTWISPIPPAPVFFNLPLTVAFSKRKVVFASSTVKAEDSQLACTQLSGLVPLPMMTCASPVSLPNSFPVHNGLHSVSVNLTIGDLVAGVFNIVLSMVADGLGTMKQLKKGLDGILKELVGAANLQHFCVKVAFGIFTSAARIAATQEGDLKIEAFSAYLGGEASVGIRRDGKTEIAAQAQACTGLGSRSGKSSQTMGNGQTANSRSSSTVEWNESRASSTTETSDNNEGRQTQDRTVISRAKVLPASDGGTATSFTRTTQFTETSSGGKEGSSSSLFLGTSTAQGNWGQPL
jgi:hypothetical protein